jgi:hypothetical protein
MGADSTMARPKKKESVRARRRRVERGSRQCLFCGSVGRLTEEHVFGDWLHNLGFTDPAGIREMIEDADLENPVIQIGHPFHRKLRIVCEPCNGGWMKGMEDAAKPLLIKMFNSNSSNVELDDADQLTLARWAFKTAAVLSQLGTIKTFPLAHCREFYETDIPPVSTRLWIGSASVNLTEKGQRLASWRYEPRNAGVTTQGRTVSVPCYSARFQLINAVFDVFGYVPTAGVELDATLSPDLSRALLPLWPSSTETIWWPPVVSLNTIGGIDGLASVPLIGIPTFISNLSAADAAASGQPA